MTTPATIVTVPATAEPYLARYRALAEAHQEKMRQEAERAEAARLQAEAEAFRALADPLVEALGAALLGWGMRPSNEQDEFRYYDDDIGYQTRTGPAIVLEATFMDGVKVGVTPWVDDDDNLEFGWRYWSDMRQEWCSSSDASADQETMLALAVLDALRERRK